MSTYIANMDECINRSIPAESSEANACALARALTQIVRRGQVGSDLPQDPTHDFPAAGLRQTRCPVNNIRLCKRSNVPRVRSPCVKVAFCAWYVCMDTYACIHVHILICLSVCLSASLRPSVPPSACLPACRSICLSVTPNSSHHSCTRTPSLCISLSGARVRTHTRTHGLHLRTILLSSARVVSEGSTPTFKITYA